MSLIANGKKDYFSLSIQSRAIGHYYFKKLYLFPSLFFWDPTSRYSRFPAIVPWSVWLFYLLVFFFWSLFFSSSFWRVFIVVSLILLILSNQLLVPCGVFYISDLVFLISRSSIWVFFISSVPCLIMFMFSSTDFLNISAYLS